jgi:hypothetical protein
MTYEGPPQYPAPPQYPPAQQVPQQWWQQPPGYAPQHGWQPLQQPPPPYGYQYPYGPPPLAQPNIRLWVGVAAVVLALIGTALQFQSVSLLTGDSIYWIGAGLAVGGAALSFGSAKTWIKVVCIILAVLCIVNVIYTEKQLSDKRQQIQQIFTNLPSSDPT